MPHIVVEHTNIPINFRELLLAINIALVQQFPEEFPVPAAIKSRAINLGNDYAVGINAEEQDSLQFIHTSVRILSGRPLEVRNAVGVVAKNAIEAFMTENYNKDGKHTQCTVEVGEVVKESFQKVVFDGRSV